MRPSIISWNLTRLCNERCRHCYLDAGPEADRSDELTTEECLEVIAQLKELAPGALLIFTGGEPVLRSDIYTLARAARDAGFTVVVGTNGLYLTPEQVERLREAGIQGVALSLDSLQPRIHDALRGRRGAWKATMTSVATLQEAKMPFVIQTTVSMANVEELPELVSFATRVGARAHNLYFLVPTGRGKTFTANISPEAYETLLGTIRCWQEQYADRFILGVKCAPHYQRVLWQHDPQSPYLRSFAEGAGGCPAGIHYLGIRPNGDVTPCPYLPLYGGNVRSQALAEIWHHSALFQRIRDRVRLDSRCGACEFHHLCGGCRARAYAATGDVLGDDPLCTYLPGQAGGQDIVLDGAVAYGLPDQQGLPWTPEAERILEAIPAFVRGRVRQAVERCARQEGLSVITVEVMRRMPPPPSHGRFSHGE